jgi:magnesium-transporting ATPase (P-type)
MAEDYYDCKMLNRSSGKVVIRIRESEEIWETIRDFEFTSARKMMSVVSKRANDDLVKCFCKGADEVVQLKLSNIGDETQKNLIE